MRRLATPALVLLTVAALALAALSLGRALALFTDTASVPANTFTTAASFPSAEAVSRVSSWTTGLTHTVGTGDNRLVLFVVGYENGADPGVSAVTYGGQSLTPIIGAVAGTSIFGRVELWYLNEAGIAAASGNTFTVTWGGATPSQPMYAAATYAGVEQTNPISDSASNSTDTSTPNPITATVNVVDGAMAVSGAISGNNGSYTWGGGWTEGTDQTSGSTTTMSSAENPATAAGTDTASATHSGPNRQAIVAAVLNPTPWWDSSYAFRQPITVSTGTAAVTSGYSVSVTFDHTALVTAAKSQADGDDVRIVYWNGSSWVELDRALDEDSAWNGTATEVWFKLQAGIAASSSDTSYYLHYGNGAAVNPPANKNNVYVTYDDFEGGTVGQPPTGWTVRTGTWNLVDDAGNKVAEVGTPSGTSGRAFMDKDGVSEQDVLVRARVKFVDDVSTALPTIMSRSSNTTASTVTGYKFDVYRGNGVDIGKYVNGTHTFLLQVAEAVSANTWYTQEGGTYGSTLRLWRDGVEKGSTTDTAITGAGAVRLLSYHAGTGTRYARFDDFLARLYVEPEPTTSLGAEETTP